MTEDIEKLTDLPGVGPTTSDKLRDKGYEDVEAVAAASPGKLKNIVQGGLEQAEEIVTKAQKSIGAQFIPASELEAKKYISTGSENLDKILGEYLFSVSDEEGEYTEELDDGSLPKEVLERLTMEGYSMPDDITPEAVESGSKWEIEHDESIFIFRKTDNGNISVSKDGGLPTGLVTAFESEFGTGKTQMAMQLCINVQLPEDRGGLREVKDEDEEDLPDFSKDNSETEEEENKENVESEQAEGKNLGEPVKAVFIDSEKGFSTNRVKSMAESVEGLDAEKATERVLYNRINDTDQMLLKIKQLDEIIEKENVKLVVVDSLSGPFRTDFVGREMLPERSQKMARVLSELCEIADKYNIAVYSTGQVMGVPDSFSSPVEVTGGHTFKHLINIHIFLRKGKKDTRIARVTEAPNLPAGEQECTFYITDEGIRDSK